MTCNREAERVVRGASQLFKCVPEFIRRLPKLRPMAEPTLTEKSKNRKARELFPAGLIDKPLAQIQHTDAKVGYRRIELGRPTNEVTSRAHAGGGACASALKRRADAGSHAASSDHCLAAFRVAAAPPSSCTPALLAGRHRSSREGTKSGLVVGHRLDAGGGQEGVLLRVHGVGRVQPQNRWPRPERTPPAELKLCA
ncbi:hypothetical protein QFZ91_001702 [Paraburkholderia sp. JPY419]